ITHCRFSCENPRSVWMDDNATLTIAMSRMVMNCTARMSPSANHFFRSESTIEETPGSSVRPSSVRLVDEPTLQNSTCDSQVKASDLEEKWLHSSGGQDLRPVLPDRACSRSGRGALVAAHRPRAHPRGPAALLRPPCPTRGLRD